ncbi:C-type lectin domain family 4 member F-like [Catharus ustulatus]|uniref:C-type lectin domain family 4 member F-like n=1 Tax=Catharus ustulatus TaxID=91951 RepID=UPI001408F879|nr:C-type lectin domain family 4 member F-like [Catharus ustulatus]
MDVQGRGELRAARAELAAATDPLWADPDGDTPSAAQLRQDRLGRWLQGLALGWRYHRGKIYLFSGQRQPWAAAEAACAVTHAHLASVTSAEEQAYLAREARGGSYWIGLSATGPGGSWRWADGTPYSLSTVSGRQASRTALTTAGGEGRAASRSTRWERGSGMTTTATSASLGVPEGPECP